MGPLEVDDDECNNKNKGNMWELDQTLDQPMDEEAGRIRDMHSEKVTSPLLILQLAFQSLGVVFGDLGTSPLYVFHNTFSRGVDDPEDVIGALSLIIYSLTLIVLCKYVLVVLKANDNGQGGTFALYSLLCRHANLSTIPNQHHTDEQLTTYVCNTLNEHSVAYKFKKWLEAHSYKKNTILILVLIGTCMVIGDGILTPAMSVLSAVGGIRVVHPQLSNDVVIIIAVVILVGLFSMQHYGTDKVGWLFAPIVFTWFILIGSIGAHNVWKYDRTALDAFSPIYIYRYLKKGGKNWTSLGGIMLSIAGIEALFADLSNFPVLAVQVAFILVVFPSLLLAYTGQAAYILQHRDHVFYAFYYSIPDRLYWPMIIVATISAVVASQATITASFSIIKQALALGFFPRVKVVHTSERFQGQIYIPEINWTLMILCIAVIAGFKNQVQIGNAYGTAVMIVMLVTTLLMIPIMLLVWRTHWTLVSTFAILSFLLELVYISVLVKLGQGGWAPLGISAAFLLVMYTWHYGTKKRYEFELHSRVSMAWILSLGPSLGLVRVPGVGLVYTELANGVPHIFSHLVTNLPAIHSIVVFVCVKYLPVPTVSVEERTLVKRIGPRKFRMFRCVARYGYKDLHKKDDDFEKMIFDSLSDFITMESFLGKMSGSADSFESFDLDVDEGEFSDDEVISSRSHMVRRIGGEDEEVEFLNKSKEAGVVHILGNTDVRAQKGSGLMKKIAVDYVYALLRKMCRENSVLLNLPHESLLNVGQIFSV